MTLPLSLLQNTMAIYRSIWCLADVYLVTIATMYFKWAIEAATAIIKEMFAVSLQSQILRYHL